MQFSYMPDFKKEVVFVATANPKKLTGLTAFVYFMIPKFAKE